MADEILRFQADFAKAIRDTESLAKSLRKLDTYINVFVESAEGSTSGGTAIEQSLGRMTKAVDELSAAQKKLIKTGQANITKLIPKPTGADIAAFSKYVGQTERLRELIARISPENIQKVFEALQGRSTLTKKDLTAPVRELIAEFTKAKTEADKLALSLRNVQTAAEATARVRTVLRALDRRGVGAGAAIPTTATETEVRKFQDARTALLELVRSSNLSAQRIVQINDNLGANYKGTEQKIANALLKIKTTHADLGKSAQASAQQQAKSAAQAAAAAQRAADQQARAAAKAAAAAQRAAAAQLKADQKLIEAARKLQGQREGSRVTSALISSTSGTFDPKNLASANAAIARIQTLFNNAKISSAEFSQVINNLGKGSLAQYTEAQRAAEQALVRFMTAAKNSGASIQGLDLAMKRMSKDTVGTLASRFQNLGQIIKGVFIGNALYGGLARLEGALVGSINQASEFDRAIAEIQTISNDGTVSVNRLTDELRDLSEAFSEDILQVAESQYQALSNQIGNAAESLEFLRDAGNFSLAAVTSMSTAVNLGTAVINAYGKEAKDAEDVFATLFKTIELGRIRADALGQTFGRVLPIANQMGVTIDELGAAMATITIQGVPAEEAMTQLVNLFTQLTRPTAEMTRLLEQYGQASTQSFIETRGFANLLAILNKEVNGNVEAARKFSREIRATNAILNLTSGGYETFISNLAKFGTKMEDTDRAINLVSDSLNIRLQAELDAVSNFFRIDIGTPFLRFLLDASDKVGGLANVLHALSAVAATLTFSVAIVGLRALTVATLQATKGVRGLTASMAVNPLFLAGVAGAAVGAGIYYAVHKFSEALDTATASVKKFNSAVEEAAKETTKVFVEGLKVEEDRIKTSLDNRLADYNLYFNTLSATNNELLNATRESAKKQASELKSVFATFSGYAKSQIQATRSEISKLENQIKSATEAIPDIQLKMQTGAYNRERELATRPQQRDRIDAAEIRRLQQQGRKLYDLGNIQDAQKAFESISGILNTQFNEQVALNRELGRNPRTGIQAIERDITQNYKEQLRLAEASIARDKERLKLLEDRKVQQELALQNFDKESKKLLELATLDGKKFTAQFKDLGSAESSIDAITKSLRESATAFDPADRLRVVQQIADFELQARKRALQEFNKVEIQERQDTIRRLYEEGQSALTGNIAARTDLESELTLAKTNARKIAIAAQTEFENALESQVAPIARLMGGTYEQELQRAREAGAKIFGEIQVGISEGSLDRGRLQQLSALINSQIAALYESAPSGQQQPITPLADRILGNIDVEAINQKTVQLQSLQAQIQQIEANLQAIQPGIGLKQLGGDLKATTDTFLKFGQQLSQPLAAPSIDTSKLAASVQTSLNLYQTLLNKIAEVRQSEASIQTRQFGGHIRQFQLGGIGPDNVNAKLSRGEMVIDAGATRSSYTLLNSLVSRSGAFSNLTGNQTNFGDININVNNTSNSPVNGKQLYREFQRELRKGTI